MKVEVVKGDITEIDIQAIVNPANSLLVMGGGLAGMIKRKGGDEIEDEAVQHAPLEIGKAIVTSSGSLSSAYVIHAPTMDRPAQNVTSENTKKAMRAVLKCAAENNIGEIAVPGLGTGVGGVSFEAAAEVMIDEITDFKAGDLKRIVLVGFEEELYRAFEREWKAKI